MIFLKNEEQRGSSADMNIKHRANSFLIVTEGERTEPLYFQDFDMAISEGEKRGYQIAWSNQTCKTSHGRV